MKVEKSKALADLEELFTVYLNGEWEVFQSSLEELREDIDPLSIEDIRRIKKHLRNKGNK